MRVGLVHSIACVCQVRAPRVVCSDLKAAAAVTPATAILSLPNVCCGWFLYPLSFCLNSHNPFPRTSSSGSSLPRPRSECGQHCTAYRSREREKEERKKLPAAARQGLRCLGIRRTIPRLIIALFEHEHGVSMGILEQQRCIHPRSRFVSFRFSPKRRRESNSAAMGSCSGVLST